MDNQIPKPGRASEIGSEIGELHARLRRLGSEKLSNDPDTPEMLEIHQRIEGLMAERDALPKKNTKDEDSYLHPKESR